MKNIFCFCFTLILFSFSKSQIAGLSALKFYPEGILWEMSLNIPPFNDIEKDKFFLTFGADFSSSKSSIPTGFSINNDIFYTFDEDGIFQLGLKNGFLFNTGLGENTFKTTPYFMCEYAPIYVKTGYEYFYTQKQGYFFITLGLGFGVSLQKIFSKIPISYFQYK